jgi:hypothetical protein
MMHSPTQSVVENNEYRGHLQEDPKTGGVLVLYRSPWGFTEWVHDSSRLSAFVEKDTEHAWHRYQPAQRFKEEHLGWYYTNETVNKFSVHDYVRFFEMAPTAACRTQTKIY